MIELLAPAGDFDRLVVASKYGADAVYVGGTNFSLRARASNFTNLDLKKASEYLHSKNKKLYVTINIVFHERDLRGIEEYLKFLESIKVDGVIITNLFLIELIKKYAPSLEIHLSTQQSILNHESFMFIKSLGVDRIVLARELSYHELLDLDRSVISDIEVFVHGGMCSSVSGRCLLSNYLSQRDANRGGCAHSCRWEYFIEGYRKPLYLGSKDLNLISKINLLRKCKNNLSLKIEGRMKSEYYLAQVIRLYRYVIDNKVSFRYAKNRLKKLENRKTAIGFFNGKVSLREMAYTSFDVANKKFVGKIIGFDSQNLIVEVRNYFKKNDKLEIITPDITKPVCFKFKYGFDELNSKVTICNKPKTIIKIPFTKRITEGYISLKS